MLNAIRRLRRAPTVSICAILCLALGLGATTAIASAIDQALLRPLPFRDPGRLVTLYRTEPTCNNCPFSAPKYLDLARGLRQIQMLAATAGGTKLMSTGTEGVQMRTYRVTGNLFSMLGVRPVLRADKESHLERHVESRQLMQRIQFGAGKVMNAKAARPDQAANLINPYFTAVESFERTPCIEPTIVYCERDRFEQALVFAVEWAVDKYPGRVCASCGLNGASS